MPSGGASGAGGDSSAGTGAGTKTHSPAGTGDTPAAPIRLSKRRFPPRRYPPHSMRTTDPRDGNSSAADPLKEKARRHWCNGDDDPSPAPETMPALRRQAGVGTRASGGMESDMGADGPLTAAERSPFSTGSSRRARGIWTASSMMKNSANVKQPVIARYKPATLKVWAQQAEEPEFEAAAASAASGSAAAFVDGMTGPLLMRCHATGRYSERQ